MVKRAILAGLLTFLIFFSGLSFGLFWDNLRRQKLDADIDELVIYSSSLFLQSQLIDDVGCSSMKPLIDDSIKDLSDSLERYEKYTSAARFDIDQQQLLYRQYFLSNVRYWLFAKNFKEKCDWNNSLILFFFGPDCPECDVMSERLTYLKKKYEEDVLIFPVNMELASNDPVANTLLKIYNVTSYPSIIIDGKRHAYLGLDNLEALACKENC